MASTSATFSLTSSSTLVDSKAPRQPTVVSSLQCTSLPTLHPSMELSHNRLPSRETWKATAYCRKLARNVIITMATGDVATGNIATGDVATGNIATGGAPAEVVETEMPEIVKKVQEAWDKLEDKYAVTSLALVGVVALSGSSGLISAIDRLPLVPGLLELVGIGYTGWFVYKNLVFKPEREAFLDKCKGTYKDIIGTS